VNNLSRSLQYIFAAIAISLCYPIAAFACNPALATVCQRYERAEAIFVGRLTKTELKDETNLLALYATFEVKETFKGVVGKVETVKFGAGDCDPKIDKVGEMYFVYKEQYTRVARVANYTDLLTNSASDLAFAKGVDPKHPVFRVGGVLAGLSKTDLHKVGIYVSDGHRKKSVRLNGEGWFEYVGKKKGLYIITVNLPVAATMYWERLNESSDITEGRSMTYEVEFRPNGCDIRQFNISPK